MIKLNVGGKRYHYDDGIYYRKHRHGYEVVSAPIGACLRRLPRGYQRIYVDHNPYYTYNGVYYERTPQGYVVIESPYSKHAHKKKYKKKVHREEYKDEISLKVRNRNGDYISIIIRPEGDGYVGPQGEYYDEFPKIDHLKVIYGS